MTTGVKIKATVKKDELPYIGLTAITKELLDRDRPLAEYVVVALVRPGKSSYDPEDGIETPSIKFQQIEVLEGEQAATAREWMNEAYRARTGRGEDPPDTLPFGDGPNSDRVPDEFLDDAVAAKKGRK